MNSALLKYAPLALAVVVLWGAGYTVGHTRANVAHARAALEAESAIAEERLQWAVAIRSARAKSDTIREVVTRRILRVDTAWQRVSDTIFRDTTVRDAKAACLALSSACSEQARLFAMERAASDSLRVRDSARAVQLQVRVNEAVREANAERDKTWRRRVEGAGVCLAAGVGIDYLRRRE